MYDSALLALTALFCLWLAIVGGRRRGVPGAATFAWMMTALVVWTGLSALHRLPFSLEARVVIAQFQVTGIVAVGPLWFLFTRLYAQRRQWSNAATGALWILPALVVATAAVQGANGWYWSDVRPLGPSPDDGIEYFYGPLFWASVVYGYVLVVIGTWQMLWSLRESPPQFRSHLLALSVASVIPLAANAAYLSRLTPDYTPMAFAASGGIFGWSLFSRYLLNVRPLARGLLFDRLVDPVFVLDTDYRVIDMNAAGRHLAARDVPPGTPVAAVLPWWQRFQAGDTRNADGPAVVRQGSRVFDPAVSPLNTQDGQLAGWLVVVRDITTRLREEEERRLLDRRLQEQQHVESLSVLAGGLAHDFNNLLSSIMGNADMLADKLSPEDRELRDMARAIMVGAERAGDLVGKMLAYAGEATGTAAPVDLQDVAREMVGLLRASVARQAQLHCDDAGPATMVAADVTQVRQVLLNLIVNAAEAVDAHNAGGSTVIVRTGHETLPRPREAALQPSIAVPSGQYGWLEVADTGTGMPPEIAARIFDPFFTTKDHGRGLGLASVQGIVRSHRGTLGVESTPGQGTTIRVWFPLA
jgi:signal transduction histidine kinase